MQFTLENGVRVIAEQAEDGRLTLTVFRGDLVAASMVIRGERTVLSLFAPDGRSIVASLVMTDGVALLDHGGQLVELYATPAGQASDPVRFVHGDLTLEIERGSDCRRVRIKRAGSTVAFASLVDDGRLALHAVEGGMIPATLIRCDGRTVAFDGDDCVYPSDAKSDSGSLTHN